MTLNRNNETSNSSAPNLSPAQLRLLKIVVSVTGVFLIVGFFGLASVLVYKLTTPARTTSPQSSIEPVQSTVQIPEGAIIKSVSMGNESLSVHISSSNINEILVIQANSGKVLNRIMIKNKKNQ